MVCVKSACAPTAHPGSDLVAFTEMNRKSSTIYFAMYYIRQACSAPFLCIHFYMSHQLINVLILAYIYSYANVIVVYFFHSSGFPSPLSIFLVGEIRRWHVEGQESSEHLEENITRICHYQIHYLRFCNSCNIEHINNVQSRHALDGAQWSL